MAQKTKEISAEFQIRLNNLARKLELSAGFATGTEQFSLTVNPNSDGSWWNWKTRKIQIGMQNVPEDRLEELGHLTMRHEIGHVLRSSRTLDKNNIRYPYTILNILEDSRVEAADDDETDFAPLHQSAYDTYYTENPGAKANPYNIGVLLRWRKWDVDTETQAPAGMTPTTFTEFQQDWQDAIDNSIGAVSTEAVSRMSERLYTKWKHLFDSATPPTPQEGSGITEADPSDLIGEGQSMEEKEESSKNQPDDELKDIKDHFQGTAFKWDMPYIQRQAAMLKKLLDFKNREEQGFGMSGRKFDPRRIDNPPLPPFKQRIELARSSTLKQDIHMVIDGSGSMRDAPFRAASHVARILQLVFPSTIDITTTDSRKPIRIPLKHIDILSKYSSWGSGENYRSLGKDVTGYAFTLFLTDANVVQEDAEYVKNTLRKLTKLGAGYVGENDHSLDDVFDRTFFSTALNEDIARMVALFLRQHFTKSTRTAT